MKKAILGFGIAALVSILVAGCSQQSNPIDTPATTPAAQELAKGNGRGGSGSGLDSPGYVTTTSFITVRNGGKVQIRYTKQDPDNPWGAPTQVSVDLQFKPHTVTEDVWIQLSVAEYDLSLDLQFLSGPQGMIFSQPALLNVNTLNFNIDHIGQSTIDKVWCVDDGETQEVQSLKYLKQNGKVLLNQAKIRHFSQYAFGRRS